MSRSLFCVRCNQCEQPFRDLRDRFVPFVGVGNDICLVGPDVQFCADLADGALHNTFVGCRSTKSKMKPTARRPYRPCRGCWSILVSQLEERLLSYWTINVEHNEPGV